MNSAKKRSFSEEMNWEQPATTTKYPPLTLLRANAQRFCFTLVYCVYATIVKLQELCSAHSAAVQPAVQQLVSLRYKG
jgi:hypothetical protein